MTMVWKKTISAKALEKAGNASVKVGEHVVFISNVGGTLYAMNGVCSHFRCILGELNSEDLKVKCGCHGAVFELETGNMVKPPFVAPDMKMEKMGLDTFPVREENGFIEVELPQ